MNETELLKSNRTKHYVLFDLLFAFWFFTEILFSYTIVSRIALICFVSYSFLTIIFHKIYWSPFLSAYTLFLLLSIVNILGGWALSTNTAGAYTKTVFINLCFLIATNNYLTQRAKYLDILAFYENIVVLICTFLILSGMKSITTLTRLSPLGMNANSVGMLAGFGSLISINRLIQTKNHFVVKYVKLLLMTLVVIFSGSRTAFIIPFLGLAVVVYYQNLKHVFRNTIMLGIVAVIILVLLLKNELLYNFIGYRIEPVIKLLLGREYDEPSMESRIHFIQLAWNESCASPLIGRGLGCFSLLAGSYGTYSHNNYTEILYSLGWFGVATYYLPLFILAYRTFKLRVGINYLFSTIHSILFVLLITDIFSVRYFDRGALFLILVVENIYSKECRS